MTTRADLIKKNTIVIIEVNGRWDPFMVKSCDTDCNVRGIWVLTGDEGSIDCNTPTKPVFDGWVDDCLDGLRKKEEKIKKNIKFLENLKG
jgi:hypothetical protein